MKFDSKNVNILIQQVYEEYKQNALLLLLWQFINCSTCTFPKRTLINFEMMYCEFHVAYLFLSRVKN